MHTYSSVHLDSLITLWNGVSGMQCVVYILANKRNGTIYIGVTSNFHRRMYEHKNGLLDGFTKQYGIHLLVYYEQTDYIVSAIEREKCLKRWKRAWKLELIESINPEWKDLYDDLF